MTAPIAHRSLTAHRLFAALAVVAGGLALAQPVHAERIDYKRLYNSAAPGVVLIHSSDGRMGSQGTGSIIDPRGLVLTNTHVISNKGADWPQISIFLKPSEITGDPRRDLRNGYRARIVAKHPDFDLALLQIIGCRERLRVLPLSDLSAIGIGEPTVAIGHPGGGAAWSLTTGTIGASFQDMQGKRGWHVFQTETALNPGNSGGPLLDGSGAVIGVNTFIRRRGQGGLALVGLNFAVKATTAREWIVQAIGSLPSASEIEQVDREERRRRIAGVQEQPAAPAARAPVERPRVAAAAPAPAPQPAAEPAPTPRASQREQPRVANARPQPAPEPVAPPAATPRPRQPAQPSVANAAAPTPPPPPRTVAKDGSWAMKAQKKKRKLRLAPAPSRPSRYTSDLKPGVTYGGDKLRALLNKRSDEAFDELDRALQR